MKARVEFVGEESSSIREGVKYRSDETDPHHGPNRFIRGGKLLAYALSAVSEGHMIFDEELDLFSFRVRLRSRWAFHQHSKGPRAPALGRCWQYRERGVVVTTV